MHDLIFISLENWDEIWRRNQFLVAGWAKRFPDARILFVGQARRGKIGTQVLPDFPNVTVTQLPKILPNSLPLGRQINDWFARRHVKKEWRKILHARYRKLQNDNPQLRFRLDKRPILWLNPHDAGHFIGHLNERATIYDITDDWELAATTPREKQQIHDADRALCRRVDATVVCSQALYDSRIEYSKCLSLVANGVDVAHYANVTAPPPNRRWKNPTFGYTGTVHNQRVDVDLVLQLAREFAHGDIVLVGPDVLDEASRARLKSQPNVHLVGAIPYAQIPDAMSQFDVCIVPHIESAFTESLNPIKLWEYLASGKPIVSANVAGFRDYPQHVEIASGGEFVAACHRVLDVQKNDAKAAQKCAARREEASGHSWEQRLDEVLQVVREISKRD